MIGEAALGFMRGAGAGRDLKELRDEREAAKAERDAAPVDPAAPPLGAVRPKLSFGDLENVTMDDLLASREGGGRFDTLFGFAQNEGGSDAGRFDGIDVSKMTLDEVIAFTAPDGEYGQWVKGQVGRVATPTGYGQIVGRTLRGLKEDMGLSGDTLYDERTQRAMVNHLTRGTGGDPSRLRATWEGFKDVPDDVLRAAYRNSTGRAPALGVRT